MNGANEGYDYDQNLYDKSMSHQDYTNMKKRDQKSNSKLQFKKGNDQDN